MAKQYQGRVFKVTRDKRIGRNNYSLWMLAAEPRWMEGAGVWEGYGGIQHNLCSKIWHRTASPSARLKPGGGPIRVRVRVEVEL